MEPIVLSDTFGASPRPQTLYAERGQPYATEPSKSPNFKLVACDAQDLLEASEKDKTNRSTAINIPQTTAQASPVPCHNGPRGSPELGTVTTYPKDKMSSHAFTSNLSEPTLESGITVSSSVTVQSTSASSPGAPVSAPAEKTTPIANIQSDDDDDPIYSMGQTQVFHQMQKSIEPAYKARWEMIFAEVSDRVLSKLRQRLFGLRSKRFRDLPSIQLMSAGMTKDTSVPAVVVLISRNVKNMQDFLDTDTTVQHLCKPRDGTTVELQVLACKNDSKLVGSPAVSLQPVTLIFKDRNHSDYRWDDEASILSTNSVGSPVIHGVNDDTQIYTDFPSVVFDNRDFPIDVNSGMGICLVSKDGSRCVRGTCGGFLQLEYPFSSPRRVGLVAGHLLEQLTHMPSYASQENYEANSLGGAMLYPRNSSEVPRHDWALFDAAKLSSKYTMASQSKFTIAQKSEFPKQNTAVSILTSRGEVKGTLSSSTSRIMLNLDHGFVSVRIVSVDEGSAITQGDSGAWVVNERLGKIYGHIIATSSNGDAYMVPLHATITEIKPVFGAINVSLATKKESVYPNSFGNELDVPPGALFDNEHTLESDSASRLLKKTWERSLDDQSLSESDFDLYTIQLPSYVDFSV